MPELPEVQTIVNDLNKKVIGEQIVDFWSDWKKNVRPSFSVFKKGISKTKILKARRIGKHIIIDLDNDYSIVIHLKMSGHLLYKKLTADSQQFTAKQRRNFGSAKISSSSPLKLDAMTSPSSSSLRALERSGEAWQSSVIEGYFNERVNQYIRHKFIFSAEGGSASGGKNGATLEFSDLRKFGWLNLVKTEKVQDEKEIKKLGIDALDKNFTLKVFKEILEKKKKGIIGTILLDQELIAGIGNIYRSEILFEARVNPKRKISTLKEKEIEKIFKEIKNVLKKAVKMRGTSDSDYRDTEGKKGGFQNVLNVYGREGKMCKKCLPASEFARGQNWAGKGKIIREKLGQRSIFYCSICQK
ncbi:hypothetical protein KKG48_02485 [Patescibacteria group bacterium]|nr:hypothetical protein [Patescibacteria group bacterium]